MDHAFLRSTNDDRLGFLQRRASGLLVSGSDRLLHFAHRASQAAPPRFVGGGAADGLASGFLCRFRVGHDVILGQRLYARGASSIARKIKWCSIASTPWGVNRANMSVTCAAAIDKQGMSVALVAGPPNPRVKNRSDAYSSYRHRRLYWLSHGGPPA